MSEQTFGQRFKAARLALGVSQQLAGRLVGRTKQTIWLWESERVTPEPMIQQVAIDAITPDEQ